MKIQISHNHKTKELELDPSSLIEDIKALIEVEVLSIDFH